MSSLDEARNALKAIQSLTPTEIELVKKRAFQGVTARCIVDEISAERLIFVLVNELIEKLRTRDLLGLLSAEDYVAAIRDVRTGIPTPEIIDGIAAKVKAS